MKRKLTKFFNLAKNSKEVKVMLIFNIVVIFILLLGNSLSVYISNKNMNIANIKVNGLSFNMTTNSGTSDDRILHLQAGKFESFNIVLTNLNKTEVKYELIYDVCSDSKCTSVSKELPTDIGVYKEIADTEINGNISGKDAKTIKIVTKNNSSKDYYIKLNVSVGYTWNELELANQINEQVSINNNMNIIAYVDGKEVNSTPNNCGYTAKVKVLMNNENVETEDIELTCDYYKNKWSINFKDLMSIPDKIELYFTSTGVPADALIKNYEYIEPTTEYSEPYYTFTVPVDGTYKIETWGAQGGGAKGGYGGYSSGEITLKKDDLLYFYVGGQGGANTNIKNVGGYNGGGYSGYYDGVASYGGGGATHIAKKKGLLSTLSSSLNSILIVSGGGGGTTGKITTLGGSGGGMVGCMGTSSFSNFNNSAYLPGGGTQTGPGFAYGGSTRQGIFGADIQVNTAGTAGGGGAGLYGGSNGYGTTGGGGSSYIGNSLLTNKAMYCYGCDESIDAGIFTVNTIGTSDLLNKTNCPDGYSAEPISKCAKSGDGYARITFVNDAN